MGGAAVAATVPTNVGTAGVVAAVAAAEVQVDVFNVKQETEDAASRTKGTRKKLFPVAMTIGIKPLPIFAACYRSWPDKQCGNVLHIAIPQQK
jgi:hypothetical protein